MSDLAEGKITDGALALSGQVLRELMEALPGWDLVQDGKAIRREWTFKNFKQAAQLVNLVAWQAEAANHHPDISFGWGQASVTFSTHSAGGATMNDLIMAARVNRATC